MKKFSQTFSLTLFGLLATSAYVESKEFITMEPSAKLQFGSKSASLPVDSLTSSIMQAGIYPQTTVPPKEEGEEEPAVTTQESLGTSFMNYIALDNGYRWDKISNRATLGGPTISVKGATQLLRRIQSYQLGARGQWSFCNAFVRASGHYGWVFDGKYREGGFTGNTRGHTFDGQAAAGYYFSLTTGVWMAALAGWAYDALQLKGTKIKTAIDGVVYHLDDIKAHQHFNGPFAGVDFVYQIYDCCNFTFGYEFHYVHWQGQRLIEGSEYGNPPFGATTGFSNRRHMDNVKGQVFKLDTTYQFCGSWTAGLGLKYQFFNGDFGKYKRTRTPLIPQYTYAKVDGLWWRSFAATIYIGGMF